MAQPRERKNNSQGQSRNKFVWRQFRSQFAVTTLHQTFQANLLLNFSLRHAKLHSWTWSDERCEIFTIHPAETLPCTQKPFYDRANDAKTFLHFPLERAPKMKIHSETKTNSHTCFHCFPSRAHHEENLSRIWFSDQEFWRRKTFLTSTKICRRLID